MVETRERLTEDEFMARPDDGRKYELVDGEARDVPTGGRHGNMGMRIGRMLGPFADECGELFGSSTGFRMVSGNIRSPDDSFMRFERLPEGEPPVGFVDGAPDLCIEISSPSEDQRDSWRKVGEYFESGASQVWHVFPETRRVVVYHSIDDIRTYGEKETLNAGDLLTGFQCRVAALLCGAAN